VEDLSQFKAQFRGEIIQSGDPAYDAARQVYNGMIDRRPRLIAKCVDVADVIAAVRFGHASGLQVAIRSGGHNAGGLGICDDGLVIDVSPIKYVRVDPAAKTARVGAGCTWGDVDHATHPFGLAVPSGFISTTGVAGLTLGGGTGYLTRQYGLTIDNLLAADVVLADGTFVTASADEHDDLFWALQGGGGNFGVVTSFLFRANPVSMVCAGPMLWELSDAADIMGWFRDFVGRAPAEINGFFAFLTVPPAPPFPEAIHLQKMCGIVWCCNGSLERINELLAPLREFRKPAFEFVGPMPFPALQSMFDALYPSGMQWYWKADFLKELGDEAIAVHVKHGSQLPSMHSTMHLYPINGAAREPKNDATPWSYRDALFSEVIVGVDPDAASKDKITRWTREYFDAVHPYGAGGAYVNFMMDNEGDERIRGTYRDNYDRLVRIKAKYDPENFFRVNQNIRPQPA